jgi:hypothetical protein
MGRTPLKSTYMASFQPVAGKRPSFKDTVPLWDDLRREPTIPDGHFPE